MINIINQIYEIQKKSNQNNFDLLDRNFKKIYYELDSLGYRVITPKIGKYTPEDTSIQAKLMTKKASKITKVIKPVIYKIEKEKLVLIQKGIVIVE